MKIRPYVEKLNASKQYHDFMDKYKDAYLVAGFFVLDFETGNKIHQIDYYIPSEKKVAAFTLDGEIVVQVMDTIGDKTPEKLDIHTNIDLDGLKGVLGDEMKNRNMTAEIKKIIAIIQNLEGKKIWTLNCILSGMEILRAHVDDDSKTVLKMEKDSILEYVKKLPPGEAQKLQQQQGQDQGQAPSPEDQEEQIDAQIEQLEKLKEELEKEKERLHREKHNHHKEHHEHSHDKPHHDKHSHHSHN